MTSSRVTHESPYLVLADVVREVLGLAERLLFSHHGCIRLTRPCTLFHWGVLLRFSYMQEPTNSRLMCGVILPGRPCAVSLGLFYGHTFSAVGLFSAAHAGSSRASSMAPATGSLTPASSLAVGIRADLAFWMNKRQTPRPVFPTRWMSGRKESPGGPKKASCLSPAALSFWSSHLPLPCG